MENENKLPLKRVEHSLTKFNEVAIPHHLDLLRQHRANIIKFEARGESRRVLSEQAHARRVASQLRSLLTDLEGLRAQVISKDLAKFDELTRKSRDHTLKAIMDYLSMIEMECQNLICRQRRHSVESPPPGHTTGSNSTPEVSVTPGSYGTPRSVSNMGTTGYLSGSTESVGLVEHANFGDLPQLQLQGQVASNDLADREAALAGWRALQQEVRALHAAWGAMHEAARAHSQHVDMTAQRVEEAAIEVSEARTALAAGERLKRMGATWAVIGGAAAGAVVAGPLGLLVGAKAAAAALLAGPALGYGAVRIIRREPPPSPPPDKDD